MKMHGNPDERWWYFPDSGELVSDASMTRLEPRVAEVFEALLSRPGQVLSRDALLDAVWGDRVVIDAALTRCIAAIRRALGDGPPWRYVETLPKRGYRFVGRAADCATGTLCARSAGRSARDPSPAPCLIVMPGRSTRSSPAGVIR